MLGLSGSRKMVTLLVCVVWLVLSLPALLGPQNAGKLYPGSLVNSALVFGLDLQGGVQLTLEVDREKLLKDYYGFLISAVRRSLREGGLRYRGLRATDHTVSFTLMDPSAVDACAKSIGTLDPGLQYQEKDGTFRLFLKPVAAKSLVEKAQAKSIEIVRKRVDETGTKEPLIQAQGEDRILLQVPGAQDPKRVRELVGRTARLTFHLVDNVLSLDQLQSFAPRPGQELLLEAVSEDPENSRTAGFGYVIQKEVLLSGDMLRDAQPTFGEDNKPQVAFEFNGFGGQRFGSLTQQNTGKLFAIVLDGRVISAPRINEPILGGRGVIKGGFSVAEAHDLSLLMRSGSLPAPLKVLEERVIGPGLGADSIRMGVLATVVAVAAVLLIVFGAYGSFGVFANVALLLNLALLLGSMGLLGATLTLPGIAGIALTLGMAVDANVLINERIREEKRAGRPMIQAIDFGYRRAMGTIIDSNLTTLIGALLLYSFGTGPVRGFAVTLSLGIIVSMFTAVGLSKVFVAFWLSKFRPRSISL